MKIQTTLLTVLGTAVLAIPTTGQPAAAAPASDSELITYELRDEDPQKQPRGARGVTVEVELSELSADRPIRLQATLLVEKGRGGRKVVDCASRTISLRPNETIDVRLACERRWIARALRDGTWLMGKVDTRGAGNGGLNVEEARTGVNIKPG